MKFKKDNGKITENPSSDEKKRKSDCQVPMEVENFNYYIPTPPQFPATDDLFKILIKDKCDE